MNHATMPLEEIEALLAGRLKRLDPVCLCMWEAGDSPCPLHGWDEGDPYTHEARAEAEAEEFPS